MIYFMAPNVQMTRRGTVVPLQPFGSLIEAFRGGKVEFSEAQKRLHFQIVILFLKKKIFCNDFNFLSTF